MSPVELQKNIAVFLLWVAFAMCMFTYVFLSNRSEKPETNNQVLRKLSIQGGILSALGCVVANFMIMVATVEDPFNFTSFGKLLGMIWPYVIIVGLGGAVTLWMQPRVLRCFLRVEAWIWRWLYKHCKPHQTGNGDKK